MVDRSNISKVHRLHLSEARKHGAWRPPVHLEDWYKSLIMKVGTREARRMIEIEIERDRNRRL